MELLTWNMIEAVWKPLQVTPSNNIHLHNVDLNSIASNRNTH